MKKHGLFDMGRQLSCALLVVLPLALLGGCGTNYRPGGTVAVVTPDFFGIGEDIANQLTRNFRNPPARGRRLILTTIVDIDNLYQTSRFGRTLTEAISTRLFRHGFGVLEIRKGTELLVKSRSGELLLSRDAALLARKQQADAIVAGTYAVTPNSVIVNLKMLDAASEDVLSVAGIEIERSQTINHLLAGTSRGAEAQLSAYER